jgi:hypothetical protein
MEVGYPSRLFGPELDDQNANNERMPGGTRPARAVRRGVSSGVAMIGPATYYAVVFSPRLVFPRVTGGMHEFSVAYCWSVPAAWSVPAFICTALALHP